jgi:hypothetical protein
VFYVNETSTDYERTFLKHLTAKLSKLSGNDTVPLSVKFHNLEQWIIKLYSTNLCNNFICVSIKLAKSTQPRVLLAARFEFKTQDSKSAYILPYSHFLTVHLGQESKLLNVTSRNNIINSTNRLLAADNNTFRC